MALDVAPMREAMPGEEWSTPGTAQEADPDSWWQKLLKMQQMFGHNNLTPQYGASQAPQSGGGFMGGFSSGLGQAAGTFGNLAKMFGGL